MLWRTVAAHIVSQRKCHLTAAGLGWQLTAAGGQLAPGRALCLWLAADRPLGAVCRPHCHSGLAVVFMLVLAAHMRAFFRKSAQKQVALREASQCEAVCENQHDDETKRKHTEAHLLAEAVLGKHAGPKTPLHLDSMLVQILNPKTGTDKHRFLVVPAFPVRTQTCPSTLVETEVFLL